MKKELNRKCIRYSHHDSDSHLTLTDLINKIEVLSMKDCVLLKDVKIFDELRFEILLNEMSVDENKADIAKFVNNLDNTVQLMDKILQLQIKMKISIISTWRMINTSI